MKVAISLLTLNNLEWTKECLRTLFASESPALFDVYVLDNGSTDGTPDFLSKLPVYLLRSKVNIGVAAGRNVIAREVLKLDSYDYLCIIHNDMLFPRGWLSSLITFSREFKFPNICGCRTIDAFDILHFSDQEREKISSVFLSNNWCTGNNEPRIYPIQIFKDVGFFDESYVQQECEDVDFNIRCARSGYEVLITNSCNVFHVVCMTRAYLPGQAETRRKNRERCLSCYTRHDFDKYNFINTRDASFEGKSFKLRGA